MAHWRLSGVGMAPFAALAACASAREREDPFALEIQTGRLGVMTNQGQSILGEAPAIPEGESDPAARARVANDLRTAIFQLATLKTRACAEGKLEPVLCKKDFAPDWALKSDAATPDWQELSRRIDAATGAIMPVWSALCDQAREKAGPDDEICPME